MRRPLFIGQTDLDQLYKIFEITGLPEDVSKWPRDSFVPIESFAESRRLKEKPKIGLQTILGMMDPDALDLVNKLLEFDLNTRISAQDALKHPFFDSALNSLVGNNAENNSQLPLLNLPDITNLFQQQTGHVHPNILKRKRLVNQPNGTNQQQNK